MTETIAVIGALDKEVRLIYDELKERTTVDGAGLRTARGVRGGVRIVAVTAGMGTVNAAAAAQYLITGCGARAIIFSGIAGAINPALRPGDVVIGDRLRYLDTDTALLAESAPGLQEFTSTPHLVALAEKALIRAGLQRLGAGARAADSPARARHGEDVPSAAIGHAPDHPGPRFLRGTIATGNRFIAGSESRARVSVETAADCVEMEGAAVAQVAAKNGVDCLVLRAISDRCDEAYDELSARAFDLERYAGTASALVLDIIARIGRAGEMPLADR